MIPRIWIPVVGLFLAMEENITLDEPLATYYAIYQTFCFLLVIALFVGGIGLINFSLYPNL